MQYFFALVEHNARPVSLSHPSKPNCHIGSLDAHLVFPFHCGCIELTVSWSTSAKPGCPESTAAKSCRYFDRIERCIAIPFAVVRRFGNESAPIGLISNREIDSQCIRGIGTSICFKTGVTISVDRFSLPHGAGRWFPAPRRGPVADLGTFRPPLIFSPYLGKRTSLFCPFHVIRFALL